MIKLGDFSVGRLSNLPQSIRGIVGKRKIFGIKFPHIYGKKTTFSHLEKFQICKSKLRNVNE